MNLFEKLSILTEAQGLALYLACGGALVCAAALMTARLLRRFSEPLRYGILFTGVLGLLAAPALVGVGRYAQEATGWFTPTPEEEIVKVPAEMLPALLEQPQPETRAETQPPSIWTQYVGPGLLIAWALGTLIGLARLAFGLWKQAKALAGTRWQPAFWTESVQTQLAQKLGLRRFPDVHESPGAPMPMVVGLWRPTIVLPESAPSAWTQPQWEAVLLHEAAHIARRDHWAMLLQRVAVVLFWWCPLAHLLARRLNELRENICDDCALQGACDRIAYAELLVESAEHFLNLQAVPVPLGLLDSARSGLEARVTYLLEKETTTMTRLSLAGKIAGAAFLVGMCLLTTAATALSQAPPPAQKKVQIKIIIDGKEIDLGDAKLMEHLEAAQKKAATNVQVEAIKALGILTGKGHGEVKVEEIAFSPDGKLLWTTKGDRVLVFDASTGKVVAQVDDAKKVPAPPGGGQFYYAYKAVSDPRIEELVKQAEAIKPGSGAEIRKALQAAPKTGSTVPYPPNVPPMLVTPGVPATKPAPATAGIRVWDTDGKKVIILSIQDGKVQQLTEQELKKLVEHGLRHHDGKHIELKTFIAPAKAPQTGNTPQPPSTTTSPDVEALRRQLDRINADLQELRKRLDTGKK